ncbi:MAG: manganese catalase family protein [Clostridiales bacterium]|nr:manganese catalase family protein [Clostridiales bacterium]
MSHINAYTYKQFGGPDGETGASMRYLSQRFAMPYREVMGILTDIGISVTFRRQADRLRYPKILPCIFPVRCYNKYITSSGRSMGNTVSEVSRFTH